MKIVVSACLLGGKCKYNGGDNLCRPLVEALAKRDDVEAIPVCPEVAGGLSVPRSPAEIVGERVLTRDGEDVTAAFSAGAQVELDRLRSDIEAGEIACAVLQSRSPSCGVSHVYDGTFSGVLVPGQGLFARALQDAGVRTIDVKDFDGSFEMRV